MGLGVAYAHGWSLGRRKMTRPLRADEAAGLHAIGRPYAAFLSEGARPVAALTVNLGFHTVIVTYLGEDLRQTHSHVFWVDKDESARTVDLLVCTEVRHRSKETFFPRGGSRPDNVAQRSAALGVRNARSQNPRALMVQEVELRRPRTGPHRHLEERHLVQRHAGQVPFVEPINMRMRTPQIPSEVLDDHGTEPEVHHHGSNRVMPCVQNGRVRLPGHMPPSSAFGVDRLGHPARQAPPVRIGDLKSHAP